jgi:hypothetical protein
VPRFFLPAGDKPARRLGAPRLRTLPCLPRRLILPPQAEGSPGTHDSDDAPDGGALRRERLSPGHDDRRTRDELRPLPSELADLIATCLQARPERRPFIPELLQALEPIDRLRSSERRFAGPARWAHQIARPVGERTMRSRLRPTAWSTASFRVPVGPRRRRRRRRGGLDALAFGPNPVNLGPDPWDRPVSTGISTTPASRPTRTNSASRAGLSPKSTQDESLVVVQAVAGSSPVAHPPLKGCIVGLSRRNPRCW